MILLPLLRLRSLLVVVAAVVVGMLLWHPDADAAPGDPAPTGEAAVWANLGVVQGQPAPADWVSTDGGPGPYFADEGQIGGDGRYLLDGSYLGVATGTSDAFGVFHYATTDQTQRPLSTVSIGEDGVVTEIDLTATGVVAPKPAEPLLSVNPVMWLAGQFGEGAQAVLGWTLATAISSTTPDLSAQWFLDSYAKNFGIGVIVLLFLVAIRVGVGVRRGETGADFVQDLGGAVVGFFVVGATGPLVGQLLINGAAAGAAGIAASSGGPVAAFQALIDATQRVTTKDEATGAAIIALLILAVVFIASVVAFLVIIATSVLIYLSAAFFLLCFAWVVIKRYRAGAMRVVRVFAVMVAAKPALFLVIGLAANMMTASATGTGSGVPQDVVTLIVGSIIMLIAGAAPVLVWNYIGVSDSGGHSSPGGGLNMLILSRGTSVLRGRR